jgi:hypothetical protein
MTAAQGPVSLAAMVTCFDEVYRARKVARQPRSLLPLSTARVRA